MTADEIIKLAKETRDAQKRYFTTRDRYDLSRSKILERELDEEIEAYLHPNLQTDLFGRPAKNAHNSTPTAKPTAGNAMTSAKSSNDSLKISNRETMKSYCKSIILDWIEIKAGYFVEQCRNRYCLRRVCLFRNPNLIPYNNGQPRN